MRSGRRDVTEFPDQLRVAKVTDRQILAAVERDRADIAGLARQLTFITARLG